MEGTLEFGGRNLGALRHEQQPRTEEHRKDRDELFIDQKMCSEPDEIVGSGWFTKRLGIQIGARYQPEGLHIHQEYAEDGKAAQDVEQPDPGVLLRSCCRLSRYRRLHCISPLLWFSTHRQGTGMRCGKFRRPHEAHTRERPWTKAPMTGNGAQTFRLDAAIEDRSGESAMTSKSWSRSRQMARTSTTSGM